MLEKVRVSIVITAVIIGILLFSVNSELTGPIIIFFASIHVLLTGCIDWHRKWKVYPVFLFVLSFIGIFISFYLLFSTI